MKGQVFKDQMNLGWEIDNSLYALFLALNTHKSVIPHRCCLLSLSIRRNNHIKPSKLLWPKESQTMLPHPQFATNQTNHYNMKIYIYISNTWTKTKSYHLDRCSNSPTRIVSWHKQKSIKAYLNTRLATVLTQKKKRKQSCIRRELGRPTVGLNSNPPTVCAGSWGAKDGIKNPIPHSKVKKKNNNDQHLPWSLPI